LYVGDFVRPIPQQLLPFEKIDPALWYLDVLGIREGNIGFMFGVISEAAVGFGAPEMALRGLAVGAIFALIHNWYARNASRFWPTLFYIWLCVWSYYTYRASSFYLLTHVITMFVPVYIFVRAMQSAHSAAAKPIEQGVGP
jgi:hypothetical protein